MNLPGLRGEGRLAARGEKALTSWWLAPAVALGLAYLLTPAVRRLAFRVGAVDIPDARKVHRGEMPRLGGLAIYLAFGAAVLLFLREDRQLLSLLAAGGVVLAVGAADDLRGISPRVKLAGQLLAAIVLVAAGYRVEFLTNPGGGTVIGLGKWAIPFTLFWLVGISNALNLIDGLDGLAAGTAAIAALAMAAVAWSGGQAAAMLAALVLAAAALGFLRHNFYPARIFMGDSGSLFLGFVLAALAIPGLTKGTTFISLVIPVVVLGIPILDTAAAIARRFLGGQPIFQPDRRHLHHRLLDLGLTQRQTVLLIYAVNLVLGGSAVLLNFLSTERAVALLILLSLGILTAANRLGAAERRQVAGQAGWQRGGNFFQG